jgi:peptidoglycan/LPS O-acetylase OafA/YrhL
MPEDPAALDPASPPKLAAIDALRGWAVIGVLFVHTSQGLATVQALRLPPTSVTDPGLRLPDWLREIADGGAHGVQLFFVVSALALALGWFARDASGALNIGDFYIRRLFRIAPMFYLAMGAYLLLWGTTPRYWAPGGIGIFEIASTVLCLHAWTPSSITSVVPGGWSVGVEVMFYLSLPLLVVRLTSLRRAVPAMLIAAVAAQIIYSQEMRALAAAPPEQSYLPAAFFYFWYPNQLPVFLAGMCAALLFRRAAPSAGSVSRLHWRFHWLPSTIVFASMILLPVLEIKRVEEHLIFAVLAAALCVALGRSPNRLLVNRGTCLVGRVSFSVYLVHFAMLEPTYWTIRRMWPTYRPGPDDLPFFGLYFCLVLAVTLSVSLLTYRSVEAPFMREGARIVRRRHLQRSSETRPRRAA